MKVTFKKNAGLFFKIDEMKPYYHRTFMDIHTPANKGTPIVSLVQTQAKGLGFQMFERKA